MKHAGWFVVVLVLVGVGTLLMVDNENDHDTPQVTALQALQEVRTDPVAEVAKVDSGPAGLPDPGALQPKGEAPEVTQAQRAAAQQQEETILDMARDYETVRDDPEKRAALRAEMAQALAKYSETVLPVAMEEMASAQSAN